LSEAANRWFATATAELVRTRDRTSLTIGMCCIWWYHVLMLQVADRLIDPGSGWRLHRKWYERNFRLCTARTSATQCISIQNFVRPKIGEGIGLWIAHNRMHATIQPLPSKEIIMFSLTREIKAGLLKFCAASLTGFFIFAQPAASEIAWTGKDVAITEMDSYGNIRFWWQAATATTDLWNRETVANTNMGAYGSPSMVSTGGTVAIAQANSNDLSLQYWWGVPGMDEWHAETIAIGNYCDNPSIAWTGSAVVVTAIDCSNNIQYWWQAAGTTTWHQETVATGGNFLNGTTSIAWTGSAVVIAAVDYNGRIQYWWQAADTTTWHHETVATAGGYYNASIAWTGSAVVIAAVDGNGHIQYWWQAANTTAWHQETVAATGDYLYDPASIAWTGSSVVITAADNQGNVKYWWQAANTTA